MTDDDTRTNDSDIVHMFASDDVRLLADLGFMALSLGRKKTARQIFNGLAVLRGGSEASIVAEASFQIAIGDTDRAVTILRQAEPSDRISTLLAVALLGARRNDEARELLRTTISGQPGMSVFASRVLKELESQPAHG